MRKQIKQPHLPVGCRPGRDKALRGPAAAEAAGKACRSLEVGSAYL